MKITYFVHGTTDDNIKGIASGQSMIDLNERGIGEGIKLGELVKDKFDLIVSSDLPRAIHTADLAFGHKYIIKLDKRLREVDDGIWTSKIVDWDVKEHINEPHPGGESLIDVEKRVLDLLNGLYTNYKDKHVAFMAHRMPQLALEVIINSKTWEEAIDSDWRNTKAWQPGWVYEFTK